MATIVCVAEKPSIAEAIARAISDGRARRGGGGRLPVYEFDAPFEGRHCRWLVTSVAGHVYSIDFPPEYQSWDAVDPVDLFAAPTVRTPQKQSVVKHLQDVAHGADVLQLWLDCDREGENICFEVLRATRGCLAPGARVLRAHFSAVAKPDIDRALASLGPPNECEALAVDARQELDLKVGVAFSRFQTRFFQGKYGDLDSGVVSYGPCQTPTLGFCVDRHDAIQTFVPEDFWVLEVGIRGILRSLDWRRGRVFDVDVARIFEGLVKDSPVAVVTRVSEKDARKARPTPLNTVQMLKIASVALGMSPSSAMHAAEHLYLSGFISYPRTESTMYPASFDLKRTVSAQTAHPVWGGYAADLLRTGLQRPRKGHDAGDHPPITPVKVATTGVLSGEQARMYDMITRHFLATVSPDCEYVATTIELVAGGEQFSLSGRRVTVPGFTTIQPHAAMSDTVLPTFVPRQTVPVARCGLRQGRTAPPPYLSECDLIGLMEQHGIGTDASIASHIQNICARNYVAVGPGRTLVPTTLGVALVHGYHKIDSELVLPKVRSAIERQCGLIAEGKASIDDVLAHALSVFEAKFRYFVAAIGAMDMLFEAVFSPVAQTGAPFSRCGKCLRFMKLIDLKPIRLHCSVCEDTYMLPQDGLIKVYRELRCPLDGFELVLFTLGTASKALGKSFPLCPYCYNFPPFEGLTHMGCNECLHPTCMHSSAKHGVCPCPGTAGGGGREERGRGGGRGRGRGRGRDGGRDDRPDVDAPPCDGRLVLDVTSYPNWKLDCNVCHLLVKIRGHIHSVKTTRDKCGTCDSTVLSVEFKRGKSPLDNGDTTRVGCLVCDDLLNSLAFQTKGRRRHVKLTRGRGRGGGRGGGGRGGGGRGGGGRGGGRKKDKVKFNPYDSD